MKTTNKKTGTKENKFKNAFLKGGAIVVSFVLISFTVSAQSFWKQILTESSLGNVAMIMAGTKGVKSPAVSSGAADKKAELSTFNYMIEAESDQPLALEPWMTNDTFFGAPEIEISEDADDAMTLEDWMINNKYFSSDVKTSTEADAELKLENWMINNKYWKM